MTNGVLEYRVASLERDNAELKKLVPEHAVVMSDLYDKDHGILKDLREMRDGYIRIGAYISVAAFFSGLLGGAITLIVEHYWK